MQEQYCYTECGWNTFPTRIVSDVHFPIFLEIDPTSEFTRIYKQFVFSNQCYYVVIQARCLFISLSQCAMVCRAVFVWHNITSDIILPPLTLLACNVVLVCCGCVQALVHSPSLGYQRYHW